MKDEIVLKKLYELDDMVPDACVRGHEYIQDWHDDVKTSIAEKAAKSVGFGNGFKALKKIMASNKKDRKRLNAVLRSSGKDCIVMTNACAVRFKGDLGLPATSQLKEIADRTIEIIKRDKEECTKAINLPSRDLLSVIVTDWKAKPKDKRTAYPVYDFGDDLPMVDAQKLLDMMPIFPTSMCFVNRDAGSLSPLYFRFELRDGILLPLRKGVNK